MVNKNSEYEITNFVISDTKNGDKMAKLQLRNVCSEEKYSCIIWQDSLAKIDKRFLKTGNVISVIDHDFIERYNNYSLRQVKLIKEAILGLSEIERDFLYLAIAEIIESIQDTNMRVAILKLINSNLELFKTSPAAVTVHHNYVGGLIQHSWECVQYAKAIFPVVSKPLNHDLVVAGSLIHDIGKMLEYKVDMESGIITKSEEFQKIWINHIHYGFSWANQNGFPELAHIIASHHGIKEFNALVEPMTPEAQLVHEVDMLSSRLGKINIMDLTKVEV